MALALRVQGHIVSTPTLTGMGERVHLGPDVGLATHVEDVVAVLEFEDLDEVILCGASYGGMPVTGAADRVADRIRLIAYVDALVPTDGQSALDLLPQGFGDMVRAAANDLGHGWVSIPPALLPPEGPPDLTLHGNLHSRSASDDGRPDSVPGSPATAAYRTTHQSPDWRTRGCARTVMSDPLMDSESAQRLANPSSSVTVSAFGGGGLISHDQAVSAWFVEH